MKVLKPRKKSTYLLALEALDKRMVLADEDKRHLANMQSGFSGECGLDAWMAEALEAEALVLNDLLFTEKGSSFQVDSIVLTGDRIHLIEVKNYEGDYQFREGHLVTFSGKKISNPLTKFHDTTTRMRNLLHKWNFRVDLEPSLIFVNPSFMMYHAPMDAPVVYPGQIQSYFSRLNRRALPLSPQHHYLAEKLLAEHQDEAAFQRKPPQYVYESLGKGLWCMECGASRLTLTQRSSICRACGEKVSIDETVVSHCEEFRILFPERKMTRNGIYDWCGRLVSPWQIQRILKSNFDQCGYARGTYYQ
ncbi:nuclease-related domain-containing protein [Atopococcus tabaci]|uniref:nuclease-related domain-containing protein n=1 Tax=Atopococcus tabaci TaxID=269774 RepID=UPI000416D6F7|nr:nuclease-related domain-containing protein [Atopococcus tabaci]